MVIDWNNVSKRDLRIFKCNSKLRTLESNLEDEKVLTIMKRLDKVCISIEDFTKFMAIMAFAMDILDNTTKEDDMNYSLYCNLNVSNDIYKLNITHAEIKQLLAEELDTYLKEFVHRCDSNEVARRALLGEHFVNLLSFVLEGDSKFMHQFSPQVCSTFRNLLIMCYSVGVSKWMEHYLKYGRGASKFIYGHEFSRIELCNTISSLKETILESFFNNYSEGVVAQYRHYTGDFY